MTENGPDDPKEKDQEAGEDERILEGMYALRQRLRRAGASMAEASKAMRN